MELSGAPGLLRDKGLQTSFSQSTDSPSLFIFDFGILLIGDFTKSQKRLLLLPRPSQGLGI